VVPGVSAAHRDVVKLRGFAPITRADGTCVAHLRGAPADNDQPAGVTLAGTSSGL
jgi:hypothetical protein